MNRAHTSINDGKKWVDAGKGRRGGGGGEGGGREVERRGER